MASRFTFDQADSLIDPGGPLEDLSVYKPRGRRLRKFAPGSHQADRFALAKEAVLAHRLRSKSDFATIQLASPNQIASPSSSFDFINPRGSLENLPIYKPRRRGPGDVFSTQLVSSPKGLFRQAQSAGLIKTSTEFWSKVKESGLSPEEWVQQQLFVPDIPVYESRRRSLRKFAPGTSQEERFALSKQAVLSQRQREIDIALQKKQRLMAVRTVQKVNTDEYRAGLSPVTTSLRRYIDTQNAKLAGLSQAEKERDLFFGKTSGEESIHFKGERAKALAEKAVARKIAPSKKEFWFSAFKAGLTPVEYFRKQSASVPPPPSFSTAAMEVLKQGGARQDEIFGKRLAPKRMGEILTKFYKTQGVVLASGEEGLAKAIREAGGDPSEASKYLAKRPESRLGWTDPEAPFFGGKPLVYIKSKEDLLARGIEDPNRFKMQTGLHEALEVQLLKQEAGVTFRDFIREGTAERLPSHASHKIYEAEFELASMLGTKSAKSFIERRSLEVPAVLEALSFFPESEQKSEILRSLKALPDRYREILLERGYSSKDIDALVPPKTTFSAPVLSNLTEGILKAGEATPDELLLKRMKPKRMGEIIQKYYESKGGVLAVGLDSFEKQLLKKGYSKEFAQEFREEVGDKLGFVWTEAEGGPLVYMSDKMKGVEKKGLDVSFARKAISYHEAAELEAAKDFRYEYSSDVYSKIRKKAKAGHLSPQIYKSELEFAAMLGPKDVSQTVKIRSTEIPKVMSILSDLPQDVRVKSQLAYLQNIPSRFYQVLSQAGYGEAQISEFMSPLREGFAKYNHPWSIAEGLKKRSLVDLDAQEEINELLFEQEEHQKRVAQMEAERLRKWHHKEETPTNSPAQRRAKQTARKTVEAAEARKAQRTAELALPAKLEDHVSQSIKDVQEFNRLGPLRRAAPYALGVALGADVLASRDKTGPFWGGVVAGAAWLLTRGKVSKGTGLLIGAGGYGTGRLAAGALSASHDPALDGFGERGFSPAMRQGSTAFGSGWKGILDGAKAIMKTDAGKALGGSLGLGIAIGVVTGDFGTGFNATSSAMAGASAGFLKGGMKGAAVGAVAGAIGGTVVNKAAEKFGGTFGEAFVGGVTTSVAASLVTAGMLRGGLFYKGLRKGFAKAGIPDTEFEEVFKMSGYKDPLGPLGLAVNPSDMLRKVSNAPKEAPVSPTVKKVLGAVSGYLEKSPTAKKYFDAAFGSPKLLEAAEKVGGADKLTTGMVAKAIGTDIVEGLPVGLGTAAISLPFSLLGGGGASHEVAHDPSIGGFSDRGESAIGRKQLTDFGSGFKGLKKTLEVASKSLKKTFFGVPGKQRAGAAIEKARPGLQQEWTAIFEALIPTQAAQLNLIEKQQKLGIWEKLLPTIKQEPFNYRGVQKKANPLTEFSIGDVNKALADYAQEKGIKNVPNFWEQQVAKTPRPLDVAQIKTETTSATIGSLPTLAHSPENIAFKQTLLEDLSSGEAAFAKTVKATRQSLNIDQLGLEKTLSAGGSRPRSINEAIQAQGSPAPAFHKPVDPLAGTQVDTVRGKTHSSGMVPIEGGSAGVISLENNSLDPARIERAVTLFDRNYSDFAYSSPHGAARRKSNPKVLEGFQDIGLAGTLRKTNTDFGTGWDHNARKLAKALLGKAAKEGVDQAARGHSFKEILRTDEFQQALAQGEPIKKLGAGGVGSVELMRTVIGGQEFRYARKQYFAEGAKAERFMENEFAGLRALQDSISPTPYGKGKIARKGQEIPVMYFEAIEDATTASVAFAKQGGATRAQKASLIKGIKELHRQGYYHGDLQAANLLVDSQKRLIVIDPMPSRYRSMGEAIGTVLGQTQDIMAAEIVQSGGTPNIIRSKLGVLSNALTHTLQGLAGKPVPHFEQSLSMAQSLFRRAGAQKVAERYKVPMPTSSSSVSKSPVVGSAKVASANQVAASPFAEAQKFSNKKQSQEALQRAERRIKQGQIEGPPSAAGNAGQVQSVKPAGAVRENFNQLEVSFPSKPRNFFGEDKSSVAKKVKVREKLHNGAARASSLNNKNPSRRHRRMDQNSSPFDSSPF